MIESASRSRLLGDKADSVLWSDGHIFQWRMWCRKREHCQALSNSSKQGLCLALWPLMSGKWNTDGSDGWGEGGSQVRPKSWNKLNAYEVQNGTLWNGMSLLGGGGCLNIVRRISCLCRPPQNRSCWNDCTIVPWIARANMDSRGHATFCPAQERLTEGAILTWC